MLSARILAHPTPSGNPTGLTTALGTRFCPFLLLWLISNCLVLTDMMCFIPAVFYFLYTSRPHVTVPIYTSLLVSLFTDEGSRRLLKRLIYTNRPG